jgi:hypothetical protein
VNPTRPEAIHRRPLLLTPPLQWLRPSPPRRSSPPPSPATGANAARRGPRPAAPSLQASRCAASRATSRSGSRSPRSSHASSASCSRATSSAAP